MAMTITKRFEEHVASVRMLLNFDRDVLDFATRNLRELGEKLKKHHKMDNPYLSVDNTLHVIENIRQNESLHPRYKIIVNQGLVLLVSYFASSVHDLFRQGVRGVLEREDGSSLLKENVKVSLRELKDVGFEVRDLVPDLLIQTRDISFQDMQSISRAFKDHLDIEIAKDVSVNNIILGQACRHVIVHSGGVANDRFVHQVSNAKPRTIKPTITVGESVEFSKEEIDVIAESMAEYLLNVSANVSNRIGSKV
jgi:hypothetical protein